MKMQQPYILTSLCFFFQDRIIEVRKGCASMRFLKFLLKLILKLIVLPVLFVLSLICFLAKLALDISSFLVSCIGVYENIMTEINQGTSQVLFVNLKGNTSALYAGSITQHLVKSICP